MRRRSRLNPVTTVADLPAAMATATGITYEGESLALFARMEVLPDWGRRNAINTLIATLKANNLWNRLDGFYMLAAHTAQAGLLNWRRPISDLVAINSPTFLPDKGFKGDGVSQYLAQNECYPVNSAASNISVNLWVSASTSTASNNWDLWWPNWGVAIEATRSDGSFGWRAATQTTRFVDVADTGLFSVVRTSGTQQYAYLDGTQIDASTTSYDNTLTYADYLSGIRLLSSNATTYSDSTVSFMSYGASMSAAEQAVFYNAINTYMDAVGAKYAATVAGFEVESIALFNRMTVAPSPSRRVVINDMIAALKTANLWNRLDGLYMFAAHNSQAALLNWRRSTALMTTAGTVTFTADHGFKGDGSTGYLTHVTSAATVYSQATDVMTALWISQASTNTDNKWAWWWTNWGSALNSTNSAGNFAWRSSKSTTRTIAANDTGLFSTSRISGTDGRAYVDGSKVDTDTGAYDDTLTYGATTSPIWLLRQSSTYSTAEVAFAAYGASMSDAEMATFYAIVYNYLHAVGLI